MTHAPHDVEILRVRLAEVVDAAGVLTARENAQLRGDRKVARAVLRRILGDRLGCAPAGIALTYNSGGKPEIEGAPFHFNLSHAGGYALVALAGVPVGIDLEPQRQRAGWQRVARRMFTPGEQAELESADEPLSFFFRIWTRKEAYAKALGSTMFKEASVTDVRDDSVNGCVVRSFDCGLAGFHAAVALQSDLIGEIRLYDWRQNSTVFR